MTAQTLAGELAQTYRQIEALVMLAKCLPLRHPLPPMRGSAISPDLALLLYELVHDHHPALVVECGSGVSSLVIGYALIWLALMAYLGWLTLRMRGVRADLEAARELLERRAERQS